MTAREKEAEMERLARLLCKEVDLDPEEDIPHWKHLTPTPMWTKFTGLAIQAINIAEVQNAAKLSKEKQA